MTWQRGTPPVKSAGETAKPQRRPVARTPGVNAGMRRFIRTIRNRVWALATHAEVGKHGGRKRVRSRQAVVGHVHRARCVFDQPQRGELRMTRETEMAEGLKVDTQQSPGNGRGTCESRADRPAGLWTRAGQSGIAEAIASTMTAIVATSMRRRKPQLEAGLQATRAPETLPAGTDVPNARQAALACPPPTPACRERHLSPWRMPQRRTGAGIHPEEHERLAAKHDTRSVFSCPRDRHGVAGARCGGGRHGGGTGRRAGQQHRPREHRRSGFKKQSDYAQRFTTGGNANGYRLTSIGVQTRYCRNLLQRWPSTR